MEALKEWVRGLVLLVLLAGCLDLVIPVNGMKKYVRMTMGLLVVLAVVRPVADLLRTPPTLQYPPALEVSTGGPLPTLDQIMNKAREFRERTGRLAAQEAVALLEARAQQAALGVTGVTGAVAAVNVRDESGSPVLQSVTITINDGSGTGPVLPVRPVGTPLDPSPLKTVTGPLGEQVQRAVADALGIAAEPGLVQVLGRANDR